MDRAFCNDIRAVRSSGTDGIVAHGAVQVLLKFCPSDDDRKGLSCPRRAQIVDTMTRRKVHDPFHLSRPIFDWTVTMRPLVSTMSFNRI